MSTVEDQVREALNGLADEARPAPLLQRLEARRDVPARIPRPRLAVTAVAAAVVVVLVAAVALRAQHTRRIDPAEQPPKVLRLSESGTLTPGRALLAVTLAGDSENDNTPAYVLPRGASEAVLLPLTGKVEGQWTQHLSADGSSFVRQSWQRTDASIEIVDLRTGRVDDVAGALGNCATLSPDGRLVAAAHVTTGDVVLIDRGTGTSVRIADEGPDCGYGSFGWAPDSDRLVVRTRYGSEVRDRQGGLQQEIPGWGLTNGSMSWSPDGEDFSCTSGPPVSSRSCRRTGTRSRLLPGSAGVHRALGWAGDRVVWLVGGAGRQRLVTTRTGRVATASSGSAWSSGRGGSSTTSPGRGPSPAATDLRRGAPAVSSGRCASSTVSPSSGTAATPRPRRPLRRVHGLDGRAGARALPGPDRGADRAGLRQQRHPRHADRVRARAWSPPAPTSPRWPRVGAASTPHRSRRWCRRSSSRCATCSAPTTSGC